MPRLNPIRRLGWTAVPLLALLAVPFLAGLQIGRAQDAPSVAAPRPVPPQPGTPVAPPRIVRFGLAVGADHRLSLAWAVTGATRVAIDGRAVTPAGSQPLTLAAPATFSLVAENAGGASVRVLPVAPGRLALPPLTAHLPAIRSFTTTIDPNVGAVLRWRVSGAATVRLDGRQVAPEGSAALSLTAPAIHDLQAAGPLGTVEERLLVPGRPAPLLRFLLLQPPAIADFRLVEPPGQPLLLRWSATGARSVTLNGRPVAPDGSLPLLPPVQSAGYHLRATGTYGEATADLQLVVRG